MTLAKEQSPGTPIDRCCKCKRRATRSEYTEGGRIDYCHVHCPPFVPLKASRYDELLEKEKRLVALKALLREVEWVHDEGVNDHYCPICEYDKDCGHAPDCRLAAALGS